MKNCSHAETYLWHWLVIYWLSVNTAMVILHGTGVTCICWACRNAEFPKFLHRQDTQRPHENRRKFQWEFPHQQAFPRQVNSLTGDERTRERFFHVTCPMKQSGLYTGLYLNQWLHWGNFAPYSAGALGNVWNHFWLTELRQVLGSLWASNGWSPGMPLYFLQFTGQSLW